MYWFDQSSFFLDLLGTYSIQAQFGAASLRFYPGFNVLELVNLLCVYCLAYDKVVLSRW